MQVENADNPPLTEWADFSDAEKMLARVIVTSARNGGTMFRGRLAECEVALALGASLAGLGTSHHDLRLGDGRTVEVKSTGTHQRFSIGVVARNVDVWVFVHIGDGSSEPHFSAATNEMVNAVRGEYRRERRSPVMLSAARVSEQWGFFTARELKEALPE